MGSAMESKRNITIFGTEWIILFKDDDLAFDKCRGYTDEALKTIVIQNERVDAGDVLSTNIESQHVDKLRVIRHEIVHAYLYECGLAESSLDTESWAVNEEMVDWIARIGPKIYNTWKELGAL